MDYGGSWRGCLNREVKLSSRKPLAVIRDPGSNELANSGFRITASGFRDDIFRALNVHAKNKKMQNRRKTITIEKGNVKLITQEESEVSQAPKIFPEDCLIDFNQPVKKVHDFIRGLSPKPGAYTYYKNKRLQLFSSSIANPEKMESNVGSLTHIETSEGLFIQCNPGILKIKEIKLEGKRQMPVEDFLRGHNLAPDTILGSSK